MFKTDFSGTFSRCRPFSFLTQKRTFACKTFAYGNVEYLTRHWSEIKVNFEKKGYLILEPVCSDEMTLLKTCSLFGRIQGHVRSSSGVVDVCSESEKREGQVVSNLTFFPHTDGAYLDGIAKSKQGAFRIGPPKIIALQCIKPAVSGGDSLLVDGKKILASLIKSRPELISTLFSRNCMSLCRDHHLAMDQPVFKMLPTGNIAFRFSYDRDLYIPKWAAKNLEFFNKNYVMNPEYTTKLSLGERQILLIDNQRLLHGRTEVIGGRVFKRVWVHDENHSSEMVSPEEKLYYGSNDAESVLNKLAAYLPLEGDSQDEMEKIKVGISLPPALKRKILKIL